MPLLRRYAPPLAAAAFVVVLGLLLALLLYRQQEQRLVADAEAGLNEIAQTVSASFDALFGPAVAFTDTVKDARLFETAGADTARLLMALASNPVLRLPQVNGIYLGLPDGSFMHVQQFVPKPVRDAGGSRIDPAMGTRRLLLPKRDGSGGMDDRWFFFDRSAEPGQEWQQAAVLPPPYDPRQRPWYLQALASDTPVWTDPYIFASTGKLGVTYATKIAHPDGSLWAVLGIDLSIESLSRILMQQEGLHAGFDGLVFATDKTGGVLAHPDVAAMIDRPELDMRIFLQRYQHPSSFERQIVAAVQRSGPVYRLQFEGADYILTRTDPQSAYAMPMHIFLAQNLESVTAAARKDLGRNIVWLIAGAVVLGAIIAYAVKLSVEVGARKRAEAELIGARDLAEAATKAKSDFLATMSHEIRTPMNGVMSMAEMLQLTRLDGDQHRMAKVIRESAGALLTVINDILDFSKIEAGKLDIETIGFSLGDVVDGVGELLATRADDRGLDLVIAIDPQLPDRRLGDPTRLRQVLLNLGGNAIKFTEHGHVQIAVAPASGGEALRFEVHDTGIGLTDEQRAKLFQPFMQADSSTARKFGGTGLGLSICHRLCEMMGGRIGVDSVFGRGSVFWFELPLPAADGSAVPAPAAEIADGIRGKGLLLVGLPPAVAAVAARYLDATGMTAVASVPDLDAAAAFDGAAYDIALVDARSSSNIVRDSTERLNDGRPRVLLAARSLVSTLGAAQSDTRMAGFRAVLTTPLNRSALWRAMAVACGLAPADSGSEVFREDMAFAPPDVESAAAVQALILVAEDNPTNQMVIRQMLSRMGFACEIAKDGAAALRLYDGAPGRYGLLLTDFHMPEMDGFALTAAVREREQQHGERLPIIALTADALSGTEEKCLEAGMDGYLTKPIDSRRLGQVLAQWLPQALPLRRAATDHVSDAPAAAPEAKPDWDRGIFDPARLEESFGSFDSVAKQFLQEFAADAGERVAAIAALQDGRDLKALRHLAHTLKGGALTVGATRLGTLAADLQDACDAADAETAQLLAGLLPATLDELTAALPTILKA
jgi:signal transduction histidine kinase/CheY-like chemotaxis protein/HPt (histidine-containing phosphotransfer) domain-containing protein